MCSNSTFSEIISDTDFDFETGMKCIRANHLKTRNIKKRKRTASAATSEDPMIQKAFQIFEKNADINTDSSFTFEQVTYSDMEI